MFCNVVVVVSVALSHGVCSSPGRLLDPLTSNTRIPYTIDQIGSWSFLVIKGPAHVLWGIKRFLSAAKTLGVEGRVRWRNVFLKCSNQNDCWSDFLNTCSNSPNILLTAFLFSCICMGFAFDVAHTLKYIIKQTSRSPLLPGAGTLSPAYS